MTWLERNISRLLKSLAVIESGNRLFLIHLCISSFCFMGIIYILFYKSISLWFWKTKKWWLRYSPTMMHFSGSSKIIADGDGSHEIKRHFLLGRKVMTNLDSILKSRDIILPTRIYLVKAMVFPVVVYGCESWTVKKAERRRIVAFELWCWRRLESPSDSQPVHPKGDQSWLFIGRSDAEAETPILWPPDAKSWLIWKDPDARKDWRREEKGMTENEMVGWHHWLNGHGFGGLRQLVMDREAWCAAFHGVANSWTRLSDWTELIPPTPSLLSAEQLAFSGLNLKLLATQTEKEGNRLPLPQQPPKMHSVPVTGTPRTPVFVELLLKWLNLYL